MNASFKATYSYFLVLCLLLSAARLGAEECAVFDLSANNGFVTRAVDLAGKSRDLAAGGVVGVSGSLIVCRDRNGGDEKTRFVRADGTDARPPVPSAVSIHPSPDGQTLILKMGNGRSLLRVSVTSDGSKELDAGLEDGNISSLCWIPGTSRIAIASMRQVKDDSGKRAWKRSILTLPADGSARATLLLDNASDLAFSADGKKLAYVSEYAVWIAESDGTRPKKIREGENPVWAGNILVFGSYDRAAASQNVVSVPASGENPRMLNDNPGSWSSYSVSPDGKTVACIGSAKDGPKTPEGYRLNSILLVDLESGVNTVLKNVADNPGGWLKWSADGKHLLVRCSKGATSPLYAIPVDGSAPILLSPTANLVAGWVAQEK